MEGDSAERRVYELAFAKLNLGLRVLGPRLDGYHEICTLLQAVDLVDEVDLKVRRARRPSVALECDRADLRHEGNLAWLAADRLLQKTGACVSVHIRLRKFIPVGAGLGGGSSDAGAVLRALGRVLPDPPPADTLAEVAGSLGSDVPYFLVGGTVLAGGRGTELLPMDDLPPTAVALVLPDIEIATPAMYRALADSRRTRLTSPHDARTMRDRWAEAATAEAAARDSPSEWMLNDFELVAFRQFPVLEEIKCRLREEGARHALMSGTGSAVFGLFDSSDAARRALAGIEADGFRTNVSGFLPRSECVTAL